MATHKVAGIAYENDGTTPLEGALVSCARSDTGAVLGVAYSGDGESAPDPEYAFASNENGSFTTTLVNQKVRFGADVRWTTKTFLTPGTYSCTSGTFGGDPASGTGKICQFVTEFEAFPLGEFEIPISYSGECSVILHSSDSGSNDKVVRVTPVAL